MFHFKLLELEAELITREEAARGVTEMTSECIYLLEMIESEWQRCSSRSLQVDTSSNG